MPVVTMLTKISGTRNGEDWPDRGQAITVTDDEAATLIAHGLAAVGKVKEAAVVDTAAVETAAAKPPRGRKAE